MQVKIYGACVQADAGAIIRDFVDVVEANENTEGKSMLQEGTCRECASHLQRA